MKRLLTLRIVFSVVLIALTHTAVSADDSSAVHECFEAYRTSILNQDGQSAVELVDSTTIAYYSEVRRLALHAEREEVEELTLMDRLMVFTLRHRIAAAELAALSGRQLFIHAVAEGWVSKNSVARVKLARVFVEGSTASAALDLGGKEAPVRFRFHKIGKEWRLDITSVFALLGQAFQRAIQEMERDENEFIFSILEAGLGQPVSEDIWLPMQP